MIIEVKNIEDCKICDNYLTLLIQDERKYDKTIDENFVVEDYFINMINKDNILLLYKLDNKPKGYTFAKKTGEDYLIDGLYVEEKYRNKGIGTILIKELLNKLNNYKIIIKVIKSNINALNLYKNIGFKIIYEDNLKYIMEYNK